MTLNQRIKAFSKLGQFLSQFSNEKIEKKDNSDLNTLFFDGFKMQIERAHELNGWFNKENVLKAVKGWSDELTEENLITWTSKYNFPTKTSNKTVAIVMAGNIPLVGFHDFLAVLISGYKVVVKQSSNDKNLLPILAKYLEKHDSYFEDKIEFVTGKLTTFDAVIATGSTNTSRYFEHYFEKYPSIIRKNRNSVAILSGNENLEELELLGEDIFQYFGLGCRSVSKLFVPENYNFDLLFNALFKFNDIINYKKYENNYDYNKAVYLMSLFKLKENGFIMLKEDPSYASPIATVFYEYYKTTEQLLRKLTLDGDKIQCIVSNENVVDFVKFGQTQHPKLWNYADDVDTIEFLLKI
ncbi:acyl-CoA reductase [Lutibacter sp.]|uniref:acyl-CoA reductase n=1 Tax=Lutibacter sp. TaxID=1925666 RepID=UPI002736B01C|nr:acyl-CoA reductase [Lutibacter sp.]MDP3311935.1 acyl-CoA reductase [Lutibacter sp.]